MQLHSSFVTLSLFISSIVSEPPVVLNSHGDKALFSSVVSADTIIQPKAHVTSPPHGVYEDGIYVDSTVAVIRLHDAIPVGWRRTDAFRLDDTSDPPTMWLIGRYDHLPVGSTFVMLADDPTPSGWEKTKQSLTARDSQKTIVRRR